MKPSDIISRARFFLADTEAYRWSDERLITILNDALMDLAITTDIYQTVGYVKIGSYNTVYDFSTYLLKLNRIEHNNKVLVNATYNNMDKQFGYNWQTQQGENPSHIVCNLNKFGHYTIYPLIERDISVSTIAVISETDYRTAIEDTEISANDYLKLYYNTIPTEITDIASTDDLLPKFTGNILVHYISGMALRDNLDIRDTEIANTELTLYVAKKQSLINQKSVNYIDNIRSTGYNATD